MAAGEYTRGEMNIDAQKGMYEGTMKAGTWGAIITLLGLAYATFILSMGMPWMVALVVCAGAGIVMGLGLGFGGAYGEGALMVGGAPVQYYSVLAGSFGFQIGIEQYSSALFFGTDNRLNKFRSRDGWTVGADLEYTAWDQGEDADIDNHTVLETVYGVVFGQEGLHVGATLEGSKYSTITR